MPQVPLSSDTVNTHEEVNQSSEVKGIALVNQSVDTAPVLQDMIKTEETIDITKPLAVLFSHSSRIRCFLDLLCPAYIPSKSIYQLMKDYEDKFKEEHDIKFKFYNCVVFVLKKIGKDYYLCMKHQGIPIEGEKERIDLLKFRDLLLSGINKMTFDLTTNTYIKVEIKPPVHTRSATNNSQISPSKTLKELLNVKDLCIIRHGESTHNKGSASNLYTDTSLTNNGINETHTVAKAIARFFFKYTETPSLYVSELFRTQQTAMIFVNTINEYSAISLSSIFNSELNNPIILIKVPCNHEFSEDNLGKGACYIKQSERANRFQNWVWKKENVPESRSHFTKKRIYVSYKHTHSLNRSYFYVDGTFYADNPPCSYGVFKYMIYMHEKKTEHPNNAHDYTDMIEASGYNFTKDQYVRGRKYYLGPRNMIERLWSWKSGGGSLKKKRKKKKKRKTLRRKSKRFTKKRFTKKRNSRRTNKKKRLTNKRRTNKKRLTNKRR